MRKRWIYAQVVLLFALHGQAQNRHVQKEIRFQLKEAQFALDGNDYYQAWRYYAQVLRLDKMNETAGVNAAICLFKLNYPVDSGQVLTENLAASKLPDARFFLAQLQHQQHRFNEAIEQLEVYDRLDEKKRLIGKEETKHLLDQCVNARDYIAKPHLSVITNIGSNINSPSPDYVPVIVPDESALYFTSKRPNSTHSQKNGDETFFEDVYVSYNDNGWKKAESIGHPINSETNDACVAISPDGQRMIVYRTAADMLTGDLYLTKLGINNRWSPLGRMGNTINSEFIETSACFSNDTSEVYFSSDRPGGLGGKDLYRVKKLPNGNWGLPYNLGPTINTKYDEDAPYLHVDGITLYFSSKGHQNMGNYDIFRSTLSEGAFGSPENLGYPINDVGNDIFFVLNVDGKRGYYSSQKKETFGDLDIYMVDTRFGDNDLVVRKGRIVFDGPAEKTKITLTDAETKQMLGTYFSNAETGRFIVVTNPLKTCVATIEAEGYTTQELNITPLVAENGEKDLTIKLKKNSVQ